MGEKYEGEKKDKLKNRYKNITVRRIISRFIKISVMPVLALCLIILYNCKQNFRLTRTEIHLILIGLYVSSCLIAFRHRLLRNKILWALSGLSIFLIAVCFEPSDIENLVDFLSGGFPAIWIILAIPEGVYLAINVVRIVYWGQNRWEKAQETRQEERIQKKNYIIEERRKRDKHKATLAERKREQEEKEREIEEKFQLWKFQTDKDAEEERYQKELEKQAEDREAERDKEIKERQHQRELDDIEKKKKILEATEKSKREEQKRQEKGNKRRSIWTWIITVVVITIFLAFPFLENRENGLDTITLSNWIKGINLSLEKQNVSVLDTAGKNKKENVKSKSENIDIEIENGNNLEEIESNSQDEWNTAEIILIYLIYFTASTALIVCLLLLIYMCTEYLIAYVSRGEKRGDSSEEWKEYKVPSFILILSISVLWALTRGEIESGKLLTFFANIFSAIFVVVLVLIGLELTRLVLKQCIESGSLLRTAIHLTFILLIKCVMGVVMAVVGEMVIEEFLSSLLDRFVSESGLETQGGMIKILEEAYTLELKNIRENLYKKGNTGKPAKEKSMFFRNYTIKVEKYEKSK